MRRLPLAALLLALGACGGPPAEDPTRAPTAAADTVVTPADAALSRAQLLDERLPYASGQSLTVPAEGAREDRVLRLWRENGRPVKLTATEPDDAGRMSGVSGFYFDEGGALFFVRHPHARYVFDGGRLVAWLDERLQPVEVPEADRAAREAAVREEARRYLAAFGEGPGHTTNTARTRPVPSPSP